jgi:hypothetical protein
MFSHFKCYCRCVIHRLLVEWAFSNIWQSTARGFENTSNWSQFLFSAQTVIVFHLQSQWCKVQEVFHKVSVRFHTLNLVNQDVTMK